MFLPVWGKWAAYRAQREPEGERRKRSGCANLSPTRVPGDALGIQYYCIACKILSVRRSLSGARKFKVERRLVPNLLNTFTQPPRPYRKFGMSISAQKFRAVHASHADESVSAGFEIGERETLGRLQEPVRSEISRMLWEIWESTSPSGGNSTTFSAGDTLASVYDQSLTDRLAIYASGLVTILDDLIRKELKKVAKEQQEEIKKNFDLAFITQKEQLQKLAKESPQEMENLERAVEEELSDKIEERTQEMVNLTRAVDELSDRTNEVQQQCNALNSQHGAIQREIDGIKDHLSMLQATSDDIVD